MSESASISSGIAGRYAAALFSIAKEDTALDQLVADVEQLAQLDLPLVGASEDGRDVGAHLDAALMGRLGDLADLFEALLAGAVEVLAVVRLRRRHDDLDAA